MPNPLSVSLAGGILDRGVEHVQAEIVSLDELEELSLEEVQQAKKKLSEKRKRVQLKLDGKKLDQANSIIDNMSMILSAMTNKLCMEDVPARDVSDLAKAYSDMLKSLNNVSRLDSVDGTGTAAMLSIEVRYKGT